MRYYIEAYKNGRPVLGNLDGQDVLRCVGKYSRCYAYQRIVTGDADKSGQRVHYWQVVSEDGKTIETCYNPNANLI